MEKVTSLPPRPVEITAGYRGWVGGRSEGGQGEHEGKCGAPEEKALRIRGLLCLCFRIFKDGRHKQVFTQSIFAKSCTRCSSSCSLHVAVLLSIDKKRQ